MLNGESLEKSLVDGLKSLWKEQSEKAVSGDEKEDPDVIIEKMAKGMAKLFKESIEAYVKSGDIKIGQENISVIASSFGSPAVVSMITPAKLD